MRAEKLGFTLYDEPLQQELHEILQLVETDMTLFYRHLANLTTDADQSDQDLFSVVSDAYYDVDSLQQHDKQRICAWLRSYQQQLIQHDISDSDRRQKMNAVNPKYVLRNYLAQLAIDDAEQGDFDLIHTLLECLRHPYDEQVDMLRFAEKRPDWARDRAGCSMLSCSS